MSSMDLLQVKVVEEITPEMFNINIANTGPSAETVQNK